MEQKTIWQQGCYPKLEGKVTLTPENLKQLLREFSR